jgi:hypothetical protein
MRNVGRGKTKGVGRSAAIWGGLLVLTAALVLAAACSGGDDSNNGTASPVASPDGDASASPCQTLRAAERYRFVSDVTIESPETTENFPEGEPTPPPSVKRDFQGPFSLRYVVDAAFVSPGSYDVQVSGDVDPFRMIIVGSQGWVELPDGWTTTSPPIVPYLAPTICEAIVPDLDLSSAQATKEEVDGLKTLHYAFPKFATQQGMAAIFGGGSDMDLLIKSLDVNLWLSDDGKELVRLEFSGKALYATGRPLIVHGVTDVRDLNDENIKVEPPI